MDRRRRVVGSLAAAGLALAGLLVAENSAATAVSCQAAIGFEGPLSGPVSVLGAEQFHFAQLALSSANAANISLVPADTRLVPSVAAAVTRRLISDPTVVAVVGPAGSQEVAAAGPLFASAGMGFISGSATNSTLTGGANTTFFRVVPNSSTQGPGDAHYIIHSLRPREVLLIDDEEPYSIGLAASIVPRLRRAGIRVDRLSVSQRQTAFGALAKKVRPAVGVVILPWQVAGEAQAFGVALARRHSRAVIFGTDGVFSPGTFAIPGSYVSSFAPDITAIRADRAIVRAAHALFGAFGSFGGPVYAATQVIASAVSAVCRAGQPPTRANVLAAIRHTDESTSILGQPIRFTARGELTGGHFFLFRIDRAGRYRMLVTRTGAAVAPLRDVAVYHRRVARFL